MNAHSSLTQSQLNTQVFTACSQGDWHALKELLNATSLRFDTLHDLALGLVCQHGHLEIVKALLTSPEIQRHAHIHANDDLALKRACEHGHLQVVKYLLSSPCLREHAHINANESAALEIACDKGHLHIVKYLLASPDIAEHADIHANKDYPLQISCREGHIDIVKYLLTSPEIKEHADIHADDDFSLKCACNNNQWAVVTYLLYDMKMVVGPDFYQTLHPRKGKELKSLVAKRDFFFKINSDLGYKDENRANLHQKKI